MKDSKKRYSAGVTKLSTAPIMNSGMSQ